MKGKSDAEAATIEANEEAGISGHIHTAKIGSYSYFKRFASHFEFIEVEVYALEIDTVAEHWPEQDERERRWFPLEKACEVISEPELKTVLIDFAQAQT